MVPRVLTIFRTMLLAATCLLALTGCGEGTNEKTATDGTGAESPLIDAGTASDFDDGTAGWMALNAARVARSTEESHSGKAAMLVSTQGKGEYEGAWTKPFLDVQPGNSYSASAWVWVPEEARVVLQLAERNANGEYVAGQVETIDGTGDWVRANVEWTFSDAAQLASVQVVTNRSPQELRFFVDDVELARSAASEEGG